MRNDIQVRALEKAREMARNESSHLGQPGLTLKQSLKNFDYIVRKLGITKAMLGFTPHGLRHQFAGNLYLDLTEIPPPIRGGGPIDPAAQRAAYLEVARQLGHNRRSISSAYLGTPVIRKGKNIEERADNDDD